MNQTKIKNIKKNEITIKNVKFTVSHREGKIIWGFIFELLFLLI